MSNLFCIDLFETALKEKDLKTSKYSITEDSLSVPVAILHVVVSETGNVVESRQGRRKINIVEVQKGGAKEIFGR